MKPRIKHPKKLDPRKWPELRAFADLVGEFIQYWGFKSVQGRMWCYLYLTGEPLDSRQLAQLLRVSPALVTQSVQVLLKYRVILEAPKGPNGVLRFVANPNVSEAVATVLETRELKLMNQIQLTHRELLDSGTSADSPIAISQTRVEQVGQWIGLAHLVLYAGIGSLKQNDGPFERPERFKSIQLGDGGRL